MRRVERFVEVEALVERVFEAFSDFELMPRWMSEIAEVRRTGRRGAWWVARTGGGRPLEWETELTVFQPDHRLAWRSVGGDVETDGEAIFEETRRQTTIVRVVLGYAPPRANSRNSDALLFGRQFDHLLEDDLLRFKRLIERRGAGDSPQGFAGARDWRERSPQQTMRRGDSSRNEPLARSDEQYSRETLNLRGREERGRDDRGFEDSTRRQRATGRPDYEDRGPRRGQAFDEALRAARQSQDESMKRNYADMEREARARDERREGNYSPTRNAGGQQQRFRDEPADERLSEQRRLSHSLTPRGRERGAPACDQQASERALRRGFDHLLDEPPSEKWRR